MVPDIAFGVNTRVALDIGCGVASFGAFLMQRNVTTLSIAPKDVHENQIQFALERGVPAMVAVFAAHRLLFPSQAFDLIHCSRCRINWTRDGTSLPLLLHPFKPYIPHLKKKKNMEITVKYLPLHLLMKKIVLSAKLLQHIFKFYAL